MGNYFFIANSLEDFLTILKSASYMERKTLTMQEENKPLDFEGLQYLKDFNNRVSIFKLSRTRVAA